MHILITGAAGFIGSSLANRLLARGDTIFGIDNLNTYYDPALKVARLDEIRRSGGTRFTFAQIDFSDAAALRTGLQNERFDRIVHLGAQPGVRYSIENPLAYVQANLVGHCNMLELARHREVDHFVYASSSSVYGGNTKLPFSVADRVDHPLSLYAATKKADELMSETYAHLYRLPQTGLRFFTVYGPWGRPDMMMWIFTSKILAGEPIPVFNNGNMWRDFTYVDDIMNGILACLDQPPLDDGRPKAGGAITPHAVYNIGNNQSEHLMKVINLLEQSCERKAKLQMLPMQEGDILRTYADIDAIQNERGFVPATSIEAGVPKFVSWYRKYTERNQKA